MENIEQPQTQPKLDKKRLQEIHQHLKASLVSNQRKHAYLKELSLRPSYKKLSQAKRARHIRRQTTADRAVIELLELIEQCETELGKF